MKMSKTGGQAPAKKTKKTSKGKIVAIIIAVIILIVAITIGVLVWMKYAKGKQAVDDAKQLYTPTSSAQTSGVWEQPDEEFDDTTGISKDFAKLHEQNNDVIGWMTIPDTLLDVPIVQGDDNAYYLNKTVEKKNNPFGVPYIDYRATITHDFQSSNLTIYGHAANDGSYFAPVKSYKDVEYYKKHPRLTFNTIYGKADYKIIGAFMEDVGMDNAEKMFAYHDKIDMDEKEFNEYVKNVTSRSYFKTNVDVKNGDKLVTLSTCDTELDSSVGTPYRMVLVARKVRVGEDTAVDVSKATKNTEMVMPADWVAKKGKANPYK